MDVWVFGYGSLIWRPGFPFAESGFATLEGWSRCFKQASPDHRGTPESPGRVLTMSRGENLKCIGKVFRVVAQDWASVQPYLEKRESGGYEAVEVDVSFAGRTITAWTWVASPMNEHFVQCETFEETLSVMLSAQGESGPNIEYVLNLDEALGRAGIRDEEVSRFAEELKMRISESRSD